MVNRKEGEGETELEKRTPLVYLVGSRMNVAMYANTLQATSKIKDESGEYVVAGRQYASLFNAK